MSKIPNSIAGFSKLEEKQLLVFFTRLKTSPEFREEFMRDIEKLQASVQKLWPQMDTMSQKDREEVTSLARIVAYGKKVIEDTDSVKN